jgi:hypothetical protein
VSPTHARRLNAGDVARVGSTSKPFMKEPFDPREDRS